MFRLKALLLAFCATSVLAAPHLIQRAGEQISDTQILQFALTLEHLENTFYHEALDRFDDQAFLDAGYPSWVRGRFEQIKGHEKTHVDFLTNALGSAAPQACTYDFPYDDPTSFVALSMALETVGASAYMGAAHLLQNKDTLTQSASILAVESRQAAWVASAVLKGSAWDGPFETPLSLDGVYSLAAQFIVSCPSSNPTLPVTALLTLAIDPANPQPGDVIKFNFNDSSVRASGAQLFVAWFDGIGVYFTDLASDDTAPVPDGLQGTVYAAIVKSKANIPTAQELSTGLVMFEVGFPSYVGNP